MKKLLSLLLLMTSLTVIHAQTVEEVTQRTKDRVPEIRELWLSQEVGEANTGYIVILGNITAQQAEIVNAENSDRRFLYTYVSKKHGDPVEAVAKGNAPKIHAQVPSGTKIQKPDGDWIIKQ